MLRDSQEYDMFREEITRRPILIQQDTDLLENLRSLMNPIEQMRNCVAHNRRPSTKIRQNYMSTRPVLEERLDQFLEGLERSSE